MVYDRFTGKQLNDDDLPKSFDLGRYAILNTPDTNDWIDVSNGDSERFRGIDVNQPILDDKHQNIHDLLSLISDSFRVSPDGTFPIIQEFESGIRPFEDLLITNLEKLRAIGDNPHSLLERNTVKVNIGRAKRISTRSYQHLTHHSEDWEKLSVLHPKPRKILNEELTIDFTVYENVLFKVFLHRAIRYLNARIKQTADITSFFIDIFGHNSSFYKASSLRKDRYRALIGRAQDNDQSKLSTDTHSTLLKIRSELIKLSHYSFLADISNRQLSSFVYHDTNVLNNHKYYKHLKTLWMELLKVRADEDAVAIKDANNTIMRNLRVYVLSLFTYTLVKVMGYKLHSQYANDYSFTHNQLPKIEIRIDEWGDMIISCGNVSKRVIVLGGYSQDIKTYTHKDGIVVFVFYDYQKPISSMSNVYFVNPIDAGSIEYSGIVIRQLIIKYYSSLLNRSYSFDPIILGLIGYFPKQYFHIDEKSFKFSLRDFVHLNINQEEILSQIINDSNYKKKNRKDQKTIIDSTLKFINAINESIKSISDAIICPHCLCNLTIHNVEYLTCSNCGIIIDYKSNYDKLCFEYDKNLSISSFPNKDSGMDIVFESN